MHRSPVSKWLRFRDGGAAQTPPQTRAPARQGGMQVQLLGVGIGFWAMRRCQGGGHTPTRRVSRSPGRRRRSCRARGLSHPPTGDSLEARRPYLGGGLTTPPRPLSTTASFSEGGWGLDLSWGVNAPPPLLLVLELGFLTGLGRACRWWCGGPRGGGRGTGGRSPPRTRRPAARTGPPGSRPGNPRGGGHHQGPRGRGGWFGRPGPQRGGLGHPLPDRLHDILSILRREAPKRIFTPTD